jgi:aminoglycoside phosphotransferase (APT) family kinase protein
VTALQLSFLHQPQWGKPGLDQRLRYYEHYMNWAYPGQKPTATRALTWLKEHQPSERNVPVLLWGDSRIGNIIYAPGGTPVAVLDWEMATFGQAEEDLAWYVYLDRHHSEGMEVPSLEGSLRRTRRSRGTRSCSAGPCWTWVTTRCCPASSSP